MPDTANMWALSGRDEPVAMAEGCGGKDSERLADGPASCQTSSRSRASKLEALALPEGPDSTVLELPSVHTPSSRSPVSLPPASVHCSAPAGESRQRSHHDHNSVNSSLGLPAIGTLCSSAKRRRVPFTIGTCYPVLGEKLFFTAHRDDDHTLEMIGKDKKIFYFSSEIHEGYMPFCADFGPINLSGVISFCEHIDSFMTDARLSKRPLVYYCAPNPELMTNLAFLMGCYLIICHGYEPEQVTFLDMFTEDTCPFLPYRDATFSKSMFDLSLLHCLQGLQMARRIGWLKEEEFDADEYDDLEDPTHADLHQLSDKFIAFKGPHDNPQDEYTFTPSHYVPILKAKSVAAVIRLNEASTYDPTPFREAGIKHYDLYFDDCTVPPKDIVIQFLNICDATDGVVAVHCLAGLGRTGTLIALWMMREYGVKAAETMGWLRIVRPGSIIGPQQPFLQRFDNFNWLNLTPSPPQPHTTRHPPLHPHLEPLSRSAAQPLSHDIIGDRRAERVRGLESAELAEQVKNGMALKAAERSRLLPERLRG